MTSFALLRHALLGIETFHAIGHAMVLFGVLRPKREKLSHSLAYFCMDTATVVATTLLMNTSIFLGFSHLILHLAYILTWEKTQYCREILDWSSIEWNKSRLIPGLTVGVSFDLCCHLYCMSLLARNAYELAAVVLLGFAGYLLYWRSWWAEIAALLPIKI